MFIILLQLLYNLPQLRLNFIYLSRHLPRRL